MHIVLDSRGMEVGIRNQSFYLQKEDENRIIHPKRISSILITSLVTMNTAAMKLAFGHDIPVYVLNKLGDVQGVIRKAGFNNASSIRRNQVLFAMSHSAVIWSKNLIADKLEGQMNNVLYFSNRKTKVATELKSVAESIHSAIPKIQKTSVKSVSELRDKVLGLEGSAARIYWKSLSIVIPEEFHFEERSQYPPKDPFNAALNYLYGILYTITETSIYVSGMDPTLGIFHADQYQKPTLSFDLIEPFRPWADRFLVEVLWQNILQADCFESNPSACYLSKKGKAILIPRFLEFMDQRTRHKEMIKSRKALIQQRASELALKLFNKDF